MKKYLLLVSLMISFVALHAQDQDYKKVMLLVEKNKSAIGISEAALKETLISNSYKDAASGLQLVYLQQTYLGLPVYNQIEVLAFNGDKLVSHSGGRIQSIEKIAAVKNNVPAITADIAVGAALADRKLPSGKRPILLETKNDGRLFVYDNMNISKENITAELMWVPSKNNLKVELAWQVYIVPNNSSDYWLVRINATDMKTIDVSNLTVYCNWDHSDKKNFNKKNNVTSNNNDGSFNLNALNTNNNKGNSLSPSIVNSATYRVIPYPAESPSHTGGTPATRTNPWTNAPGNATTLNWHSTGTADYNYTRGNNVWAQEDRNNNNGTGTPATSTTAADPLSFDFIPSFSVAPTQTSPTPNQQFNTTNLFYWNNIIHDIMYQYGFDEVSGNFQANNLNRGGAQNDYVMADAQDGGGTNNANFATPPDGGNGRMQMYLWNGTPQKDGDVDNGIICHEAAHGISNRLTGGPAQAGCLQNDEQMGEGWSDYYGLMLTQNWATATLNTGFSSPRGLGTYAIGQSATSTGIRSQKYCTNFAVNNKVYASTIPTEVHDRGEIWCAVLWDMTWNIINQVGSITANLYNGDGAGGNVIALKLVTLGMKLQPCSPGFIDGRDAILQADQILYNGIHQCVIWEAFRRRGMGAFASQGSSGSVTDQVADYTLGNASLQLTQSVTQVQDGQNITFTNTLSTGNCAGITNFTLTDTLPTNVTYVSGGSYNSANRVVSFPVTLAASQTQTYSFTVLVNNGAYYPTVTLFQDSANGPLSNYWTPSNTRPTGIWSLSNARAYSPTTSYFSNNIDTTSDQKLTLTNAVSLGATPPPLSFRYWLNSESTYDGAVLEASTNGGTTWTDMQPNIVLGGYIATMDATTLLAGRRAWSGSSSNKWIKTKVNLLPYANQNLKIRFRFTSDVGTNLEGIYVDDIAIRDQAVVEMQSNLYNSSNVRVALSDTFTIIMPPTACAVAVVSTDPANTTVCAGSNATFNAAASGNGNQYQWQVSNDGGLSYTNISGANSSTYTVNATTAENNYRYRLIVNNACPSSDTSAAAILTVTEPASITGQPVSQTLCSGNNASFSVTGNNVNAYQWQVSTDGGATFSSITNASAATLVLSNITSTMNNNQYQVLVTGCAPAPINSSIVTLTVNSAAAISSQPVNQIGCAGSNVTFTATCTGTNITYQWEVSTDGGITYSPISGGTNSSLTIANITAADDNNRYRVIAVSSDCPGDAISVGAILTVSNAAVITNQPTDVSTCEGSNTTLSVTASGTGLSYQWQVSTDGGATFTNINGQTNNTITISNINSTLNGYQYHVVVNNTCSATGAVSTAATLQVLNATSISNQPSDVSTCNNSAASFSIVATGTSISYQWQMSTDGGVTYTDIAGETNSSLSFATVTSSMNNNKYRVVITSTSCNTITSNAATLSVSTPASIGTQPSNVDVCENSSVNITASAQGTAVVYQWQVSTDGGVTFTNINGANTATLDLGNVTTSMNNNKYRLIVTESNCGSINSDVATLTVNALPVVTLSATPANVIMPGQTITLSATSTPAPTNYTWYYNGNVINGQSGSSITIGENQIGNYYVAVTDGNGCNNTSTIVNVRDTILNYTFIYPNPNKGQFQVRFEGIPYNGQARTITMYDAKGARVYREAYHVSSAYEVMNVNVEQFSRGVYTLVLSDASGETLATGKVVIQ